MKRKKWSEAEEKTLLNKYSELLNSGALSKLKTREKKFKPIADHVNSAHHLRDPLLFPFKWSWRDVSIKVQNMRHQYLGVKQKIRNPDNSFNWEDGANHWENFFRYKEVFGDVDLEIKGCGFEGSVKFGDEGGGRVGFRTDSEESEDGDEEEEDLGDDDGDGRGREMVGDSGFGREKKHRTGRSQKRLRIVGTQVLGLRDALLQREVKRRERDWSKEEEMMEREDKRREKEFQMEALVEEKTTEVEMKELRLLEDQMVWARKEMEKRLRLERELEEERERRMKAEEKREEDEMEWRERLIGMQMEHQKQMVQMHAHALQNQMQILGAVTRLACQFFGVANDGLGAFPHHVLQNLQHSVGGGGGGGGLGDNGKAGSAASPSEFCTL
ncbi:unnamed protein product [Cuscuta campestris]|uniref:Uncharacterized protein n=1 Tax=Cuscuta campestris TaxID=132261 RepID=A0A484LFS1_9ASTE|nr:unnamed protein product [Cuscuta campestris]